MVWHVERVECTLGSKCVSKADRSGRQRATDKSSSTCRRRSHRPKQNHKHAAPPGGSGHTGHNHSFIITESKILKKKILFKDLFFFLFFKFVVFDSEESDVLVNRTGILGVCVLKWDKAIYNREMCSIL